MSTTATVTATLVDPSQTSLLGNAFVRFRLRNFQGFVPVVSGTSVICETQLDALPSPAGSISQVITCNTAISPSNTFWTIEFWNQGRILSSGNYIINGATSLNTASTISNTPAPQGPSAIVFENNGAMNSSQTLLNLESTDSSVVITDKGAGTINLQASTVAFNTAGQGGFVGAGFPFPDAYYSGASSGGTIGGNANQVTVFQFSLKASYTISKVSARVVTGAAGQTASFGIYNLAGNKLLDSTALSVNSSSTSVTTTLAAPVTLPPGTYYFAQSTTGTSATIIAAQNSGGASSTTSFLPNLNVIRVGQAANATSGGVLPATLGSISSDNQGLPVCLVFFEV